METSDPVAGALGAFLCAAGFNALGVLEASRYNALVPPPFRLDLLFPLARSALVLGAGGRALFDAFERSPEAAFTRDPLDSYTRRIANHGAAWPGLGAARSVFAFERRGGVFADFVALGHAAGLGAPSRLGLLVHPTYGPWFSLRAVILCERALVPTPELLGFTPCEGCPAPCADACHGEALAGARFDTAACLATRLREPACKARCDARRACVLGREHVYREPAEAHHMRAAGLLMVGG
ncbi:MAG TPA: hypothetical protein VKM54_28370 [Myxococcota bacterium]|nr:hypothetical protein [Myxococcota bacterium]